ncbi:MAG: hypothetical protein IJH34_09700 [Romboutsia sp.]|nr:hypothetical protein [Romboutsia sp.]
MKIIEKIKSKFTLGIICGLLIGCVGTSGIFMYMNKNRQMPGNPPTMNGERPEPPNRENGERPEPPNGTNGQVPQNQQNNNSGNSTTDNNIETQTQ